MVVTEASDRLIVESCYDATIAQMVLSFHFLDIEPNIHDNLLPWMAIGYRTRGDICAMIPPGGVSDVPLVVMTHHPTSEDTAGVVVDGADDVVPEVRVHRTMMPPTAKQYDENAYSAMIDGMIPLTEFTEEYSNVSVSQYGNDKDIISLHFNQAIPTNDTTTDMMFLMYAIGITSRFDGMGHTRKGCFQIQTNVSCSDDGSSPFSLEDYYVASSSSEDGLVEDVASSSSTRSAAITSHAILPFLFAAALLGWRR